MVIGEGRGLVKEGVRNAPQEVRLVDFSSFGVCFLFRLLMMNLRESRFPGVDLQGGYGCGGNG